MIAVCEKSVTERGQYFELPPRGPMTTHGYEFEQISKIFKAISLHAKV
jgi:hypothetical protein